MSRLINTEEFIKRIDHYPPDIRDTAKKELRYCKTVDAVPVKHGHWVKEQVDHTEWDMLDHVARCSNCGCVPDDHYTFAYVNMMWKYCPECGSKMDEVTE